MDIREFFSEHGIDPWASVPVERLGDADQAGILGILPAARSVIVFGRDIPVFTYRLPPNEKTREMHRIAAGLHHTAILLAGTMKEEGDNAVAAPLYLPVTVSVGSVRGVVRLKEISSIGGLGSIGRNTLLLSPRYGPRLILSGVITSRESPVPGPGTNEESVGEYSRQALCTGCERCVRVCPGKALGGERFDLFRCHNVSAYVSPRMIPLVMWLLNRPLLQRCIAPLAPMTMRLGSITCSRCVTECPLFRGNDEAR